MGRKTHIFDEDGECEVCGAHQDTARQNCIPAVARTVASTTPNNPKSGSDQSGLQFPETALNEKDTQRLDFIIEWLGMHDDLEGSGIRDWNDKEDARVAIDKALQDAREGTDAGEQGACNTCRNTGLYTARSISGSCGSGEDDERYCDCPIGLTLKENPCPCGRKTPEQCEQLCLRHGAPTQLSKASSFWANTEQPYE